MCRSFSLKNFLLGKNIKGLAKFLILMLINFSFMLASAKEIIRDSGPISIDGGIIPPGQNSFFLSLEKLKAYPDATFQLTCDILNPNYLKQYPVVIKVKTDDISPGSVIYLADCNVGNYQCVLRNEQNSLIIMKLAPAMNISSTGLYFDNFDSIDSVTIQNCMAYFAT